MAVLPATMASVHPRLRLHQNQPRNINISHKNLSIFPHPSAEPEGSPTELRGSLLDLKGPTHDVLVSQNFTHNPPNNQQNTKSPAADQLQPTTLPTIPLCLEQQHCANSLARSSWILSVSSGGICPFPPRTGTHLLLLNRISVEIEAESN